MNWYSKLHYHNSDCKRQKIHPDAIVAGEDQDREVDQGEESDKQKKEHPEPEKHKNLLNNVVCGQQAQIVSRYNIFIKMITLTAKQRRYP